MYKNDSKYNPSFNGKKLSNLVKDTKNYKLNRNKIVEDPCILQVI